MADASCATAEARRRWHRPGGCRHWRAHGAGLGIAQRRLADDLRDTARLTAIAVADDLELRSEAVSPSEVTTPHSPPPLSPPSSPLPPPSPPPSPLPSLLPPTPPPSLPLSLPPPLSLPTPSLSSPSSPSLPFPLPPPLSYFPPPPLAPHSSPLIVVRLPPLRERRGDVALLVEQFLRASSLRRGRSVSITPAAVAALSNYDWPGNVRELENTIERLVVFSRGEIDVADLPPAIAGAPELRERLFEGLPTLDELERRYLLHVLQAVGGNRSRAAEALGIDRRTLYRMAERFDIDLSEET